MSHRPSIGLIGLGRMGTPMARRLIDAEFSLLVHSRNPERVAAFAESTGAGSTATPREMAERCNTMILMVSGPDAVEQVCSGDAGLVAGLAPGQVLIDMGTTSVQRTHWLGRAVSKRGATTLDAPVFGSTAYPASGDLMAVVGGDLAVLQRCSEVLAPIARKAVHVGPLGAGQALKLAVNGVLYTYIRSVAEALAVAQASGIDPTKAYTIIEESTVGAPVLDYRRSQFLESVDSPVAFPITSAVRDLDLLSELVEASALPTHQAGETAAAYENAVRDGLGNRDIGALFGYVSRRS